jgi:predicted small integral membrane protein
MTETRIVKIVMVGSLALFAGLVTFDNLIDYETNYAFVRHVLSMDTTPPGNALMHRSIASPSLWRAAYALIIAGEGATALGFAAGATFLLRHLRSQTACFNRAKGLTAVADYVLKTFGSPVLLASASAITAGPAFAETPSFGPLPAILGSSWGE